jgi:ESCRT-I complex subunit TSG101
LYTLAAEEKGIADALFVLGRALDKGRVGADVFVKVCLLFVMIVILGRC